MKTTIDMIASGASIKKTSKKETTDDYVARVTHCDLANKNIDELDGFDACKMLSVLYLYDNSIATISGLESCRSLTRIHLANNSISCLGSGLNGLVHLHYLNLRSNCIAHVDGLADLPSLEILHLDRQKLPRDTSLSFAHDTLANLSQSLKTLTIAHNSVDSLSSLRCLQMLEQLDVSNNAIANMETVEELAAALEQLRSITVKDNPLSDRYLRQKLIRACSSLQSINGKDISDTERVFTERLQKVAKTAKPKTVVRPSLKPFEPKPIPHLPPFASQYRDLYIQKLQEQHLSAASEDY
ncbi:hypothetical protein HDU91_004736 [Kappamyces sp. JEL0680]|nr:hypothetical protein HDU91_004736 [Kappamyces sp. JEL0680]